ncbi:hypothetical protein BDR22DRAFT_568762 [Usnea florida]
MSYAALTVFSGVYKKSVTDFVAKSFQFKSCSDKPHQLIHKPFSSPHHTTPHHTTPIRHTMYFPTLLATATALATSALAQTTTLATSTRLFWRHARLVRRRLLEWDRVGRVGNVGERGDGGRTGLGRVGWGGNRVGLLELCWWSTGKKKGSLFPRRWWIGSRIDFCSYCRLFDRETSFLYTTSHTLLPFAYYV